MDTGFPPPHRMRSRFSYRSFLRWEFGYVLILLGSALAGEKDALKLVANGYALIFVLRVGVLLLSTLNRLDGASRVLLGFVGVFAVVNLLVNADAGQLSESIKILSIFMFYLAGRTTDTDFFERSPGLLFTGLFVALPVLSALVDLYRGGGAGELDEAALSFFANRNNAVAFAVVSSWSLMIVGARPWFIIGYLIVCVLAFKTVGALVAILIALYVICLRFNVLRTAVLVGIAAGLYVLLAEHLEILSRASIAITSLNKVLAQTNGIWELGRMDFGQIYDISGTSDVSLLFRLKHWINLLQLYADGSLIHQLFGFGVSSSLVLTDLNLLPHCDYLRMFFEFGPGVFLCFVVMNIQIIRILGRRLTSIPVIFILVYLLSDNLVNNFLVMSIFFFTVGALVRQEQRSAKLQVVRERAATGSESLLRM